MCLAVCVLHWLILYLRAISKYRMGDLTEGFEYDIYFSFSFGLKNKQLQVKWLY